ncbi:hypothetical protein [Planococcus sp. YIM B11945]|uniref:hypothetical protein n=1 Tax=Planococcus sp. YIM B11945 TaxID=3435410 RepID=UPI003D7CE6D0
MNHPLENAIKERIMEAFEGPPSPYTESWFTNNQPNAGIFGAMEGINVKQASISIYGSTLAAHIDHVRYHLWGTNELLKSGVFPEMDWEESWKIASVDEVKWSQIQEELRNEYARLLKAFDNIQWTEYLANEISGSIAHSAYHLGAIRQMLKGIKD